MEKIDILEVVGRYTKLRRRGREYVGLCPFHKERTPSFYVDPEKGVYHCFGCGASGNAITFLSEIEGITKGEAVRLLADMFGLEVEGFDVERKGEKRDTLYRLLAAAKQFYKSNLLRNRDVMDYLKSRGLTAESMARWEIGYSPDPTSLIRFLLKEGFTSHQILASGVGYMSRGDLRDMMAGRVVFPIYDVAGRVVSFGGRSLREGTPKYLNGRDTVVFNKSRTLYGLHRAKVKAREKGYFYLVEGYFDVILMHQRGYDTAVAPLGTSFTEEHAKTLYRFAPKVILIPDSDEAGRKSAFKSAVVLARLGIVPQVILLPRGEDPADHISGGKELPPPMDIVDFLLGERTSDPVELKEKLNLVLPLLRAFRTSDEMLYHYYVEKVSKWAGFRVSADVPVVMRRGRRGIREIDRFLILGYYYGLRDMLEGIVSRLDVKNDFVHRLGMALKEGLDFADFYEMLKPEEAAAVHGDVPSEERVRETLARILEELEAKNIKESAYTGDVQSLLELYRRRAEEVKGKEVKV